MNGLNGPYEGVVIFHLFYCFIIYKTDLIEFFIRPLVFPSFF